ncbi:MAG: hypothetical protein WC282_03915 [Bacilli bacterium]|jgi:hypothetical protein
MNEEEKDNPAGEEGRPTKDLEIDDSKLSPEEKEANKVKFPKGMLIFIIAVIVLIVGLSITVLLL